MSFIHRLFNAFSQVPAYCRHIMTGKYMLPALIFVIIFLVVIFFTSKVVNILRRVFVLAAVILAVIGYFRNDYALIWVNIIALIVLAIARLLRHIFVTVQEDRANAKIEAQALAKARKRRGSWETKQAYSGESNPNASNSDSDDTLLSAASNDASGAGDAVSDTDKQASAPASSSEASDSDTVQSSEKKTATDPSLQQTSPIPAIPEEDEEDDTYANRDQIMEAIHQLKDLKDKGVLTEEEFNKKKAELYSRMG